MIVVRFKVTSTPEGREQLRSAFTSVVGPSRKVKGALHFDIAQDLTDPNSFVATEVFEDKAALERQETLSEVHKVLELLPTVLAGEPEATIYHVSSAEAWG